VAHIGVVGVPVDEDHKGDRSRVASDRKPSRLRMLRRGSILATEGLVTNPDAIHPDTRKTSGYHPKVTAP
jgi:hypothetical protein